MIVDAAGGNKAYMQTFKDLGIQIKDSAGNLRQPNAIFEDVAEISTTRKMEPRKRHWQSSYSESRAPR